MRRTRIAAVLTALSLGSVPGAFAQTCQTFSGLTYGGEPAQKLDLLVPQGAASPVPLVIYIHGGGWISGSRTPIPAGISALCSRGYAVASLDYRLSDQAVWPAQIQDVKGAVRWLRARAATYNLDPDRFAAWGWSAGGQLAAMLGTTGELSTVTVGGTTVDLEGTVGGHPGVSSRVQAVIDWYGQSDFLRMRFYQSNTNHDSHTSPEGRLLGGFPQQLPELAATAGAVTFASADDPPFLLMHGDEDPLVPFNQSELLAEALRAHRVETAFVPLHGAGHSTGEFTSAANLQIVYDWLDDVLKNTPAVTVGVQATDASASEAGSGAGVFTLTRTGGGLASPLTVRWAVGGTARIGTDYSLGSAFETTIPAGASSAAIVLTPVQDALAEGAETALLKLAYGPAYRVSAGNAAASVSIADDDLRAGLPVVTLTASDAVAAEAGADGGVFKVSVDNPPAGGLAVRYSVSGTAENGKDYEALSGVAVVPPGASSVEIPLAALADAELEIAETAILTIEPSPSYQAGSPAVASARIAVPDLAPSPIVSVSAADAEAAETGATGAFVVTRTGPTSAALTVGLRPGGTAREGTDYATIPGTITFATGVSRLFVDVDPFDDNQKEGEETVTLAVEPQAGMLAGPGARIVLADDESPNPQGFYTVTPCRIVDTRGPASPWGAPALASGEVRVFEAGGRCGIPADATAVSVNLTVVSPPASGHATLMQTGTAVPFTSSLNFRAGQTRANSSILRLVGAPPSLAVFVYTFSGSVDLIVDVNGYFR